MKNLTLRFVALLLLVTMAYARNPLDLDRALENSARDYMVSSKMASADADLDFQTISVEEDDLGQSHVRLQPILNGLPVHGEQIIVHSWTGSKEVIGFDGELRNLPTSSSAKATVDPMDAFEKSNFVKEYELTADPELVYVLTEKRDVVLSYMMEITYTNELGPQRDKVFVDAKNGQIAARFPQNWYGRNRQTYTANNSTSLPGTLRRNETSGNVGDNCIDSAHNYAGSTYDYFYNSHGRDSLNGSGMTLKSSAHYDRNLNNAYWNGSQMIYGDGDGSQFSCLSGDMDVVAHELTHGVTQYTANLTYSNESGALNEAASDIFAAAVEAANGASSSDIWTMGENVYTPGTPGDGLRYMNNPTRDGQSKDYYPERYTGSADNGGVHLNSGIANLFYYLLVQGGTHPRGKTSVSVTGIGFTDASKIWYRALATKMTASTNFSGARTACLNSASDLFGASSTQYDQVCKAWAAVGVGSATSCTGGGGGGGSATPLTNGQTVTGVNATTGAWSHFYIDVPSGATNLVVTTTGGSGDLDLYNKFGSTPTTSSYDCKSDGATSAESCTIAAPSAGRYYIGAYAYASFSSVSISASYTTGGGGTCTGGGSVPNVSAATGTWKYYTFNVAACATTMTVATSGGTGDADLYLRFGANPTQSVYSCRPYLNGNAETCTVASPTIGTWHIGLHAYSAFSGLTLTTSYQ